MSNVSEALDISHQLIALENEIEQLQDKVDTLEEVRKIYSDKDGGTLDTKKWIKVVRMQNEFHNLLDELKEKYEKLSIQKKTGRELPPLLDQTETYTKNEKDELLRDLRNLGYNDTDTLKRLATEVIWAYEKGFLKTSTRTGEPHTAKEAFRIAVCLIRKKNWKSLKG